MDDLERIKLLISAEKMDDAGAVATYRGIVKDCRHLSHQPNLSGAASDLCTRLENVVNHLDVIRSQRDEAKAQRDVLLNLVVRPFRGRWQAPPGDKHMGGSAEVKLYATREEAIAAAYEAAAKVAADDQEWEHPTRDIF